MRKLFLSLLVFYAFSSPLIAQRFQGAVMAGMNLSQLDGDEVVGYHKVGGQVGLAAILPIKKFDITLETAFSQKGAHEGKQYNDTINGIPYNGEYNLTLNYVEVPLLAHYTDRERITIGAGFSWGRLVSYKEVEHGGSVPPYSDTVAFNKNDFNVLVDLQIRIYQRLRFNVRYAYSLAPIREREFYKFFNDDKWTRQQYNNLFTFRLVYVFNEAVPSKRRTQE